MRNFQYPQSGSRPCRLRAVAKVMRPIGCFQYPQSGSRPCRDALYPRIQVKVPLSVPSKRVETLPPTIYYAICPVCDSSFSTLKAGRDLAAITTLSSGGGNTTFQYPQSGSRPCRVQSTLWFTPYFRLSVPSKRVETLPLKRLIAICPLAGTFSTLKAGRDLAAAAPLKRFSSNMYFQYPQSGSRPCRRRFLKMLRSHLKHFLRSKPFPGHFNGAI